MSDHDRGIKNRGVNQQSSKGRMVKSSVVSESTNIVAIINIIGHASARWKSSGSDDEADNKNQLLSELRTSSSEVIIKKHLEELLPQIIIADTGTTAGAFPDRRNDGSNS